VPGASLKEAICRTKETPSGASCRRDHRVNGSLVSIHGRNGNSKVTLQAKAQIVKTATVKASAVKVGLCAFVQGTSTDKGANVSAQSVRLFNPTARGCIGR
jgi:hypothetical protein